MERYQDFSLRSELIDVLSRKGVPRAAWEFIAAETAKYRHERRIEQAKLCLLEAARAYCETVLGGIPEFGPQGSSIAKERALRAIGWAYSVADGVGVGGPNDSGGSGCSTTRLPVLRKLGKGRKQASDGGAWTAAIGEAGGQLAAEATDIPGDVRWRLVLYPGIIATFPGIIATAADDEAAPGITIELQAWSDEESEWRGAYYIRPDIPPWWARNLAREGVRLAAGLEPVCEWVSCGVFDHEGRLPQWGDVLAQAEESLRKAEVDNEQAG